MSCISGMSGTYLMKLSLGGTRVLVPPFNITDWISVLTLSSCLYNLSVLLIACLVLILHFLSDYKDYITRTNFS